MPKKKSTVAAEQLSIVTEASPERGPTEDADRPDRKRWFKPIRSVKFATARYSNKNVAASGLAPVRVTRWPPRWKLAYQPTSMLDFAPQAWMLKAAKEPGGHVAFNEAFAAQLAGLDREAVAQKLIELCGDRPGVVLLCFEDLRIPGNYCHRQQLAAWLAESYGVQVEELQE